MTFVKIAEAKIQGMLIQYFGQPKAKQKKPSAPTSLQEFAQRRKMR